MAVGDIWSGSISSDSYKFPEPSSNMRQYLQDAQRQRDEVGRQMMEAMRPAEPIYQRIPADIFSGSVTTTPPKNTLTLIKKSIKEIKAEAVGEKAQSRIQAKIDRLLDAGALAQATILDVELRLRVKLMRVQEWKYKVLPYEAIKEYESANKNWDGIGGRYKVHIDLLENYVGTLPQDTTTEAKDKIIPDKVLDEIETAKGRQVFDKLSVLWVEKIKDPLLLGCIDGCADYFLICEWGSDVSFDDLVKDKNNDK